LIISLNKLPLGSTGKLYYLNINNSNLKRRLLDLGLVKNTTIKPLYKSPLNDPTSYLIRGSVIALREDDTKNIFVITEGVDNGTN
jgi:ferrous iron transport protein A